MQRLFWVVVGVIVATLLVVFLVSLIFGGFVTEDYGVVCTRCLERYTYVDRSICGIRYYRVIRPEGLKEPFYISRTGATAQFAPDTYEKIFVQSCAHHLIRYGGFGRQTASMEADGVISTPPGIEVRIGLLARLFEAFNRVPDRDLAQETYAMIDRGYPETLDWHSEVAMPNLLLADSMPDEPASILFRGLAKVRNSPDWRAVLDAAEKRNGNIPLLKQPQGTVR